MGKGVIPKPVRAVVPSKRDRGWRNNPRMREPCSCNKQKGQSLYLAAKAKREERGQGNGMGSKGKEMWQVGTLV